MMKKIILSSLAFLSLGLSACGVNDGDLIEIMNEKVATPLCLDMPMNRQRVREAQWGGVVEQLDHKKYVKDHNFTDYDFILRDESGEETKFAYTKKARNEMVKGYKQKNRLCYGEAYVSKIIDRTKIYEEKGREFLEAEGEIEIKKEASWAKKVENMPVFSPPTQTIKYRFVHHDDKGWIIDRRL